MFSPICATHLIRVQSSPHNRHINVFLGYWHCNSISSSQSKTCYIILDTWKSKQLSTVYMKFIYSRTVSCTKNSNIPLR